MNFNTRLQSIIHHTVDSSRLCRYGMAVVLIMYAFMVVSQSLLLPVFEGPDEQRHYAYARYIVNNRALPPITKEPDDVGGMTYRIGQESGQPPLYYALVALVTAPFSDADNAAPFVQSNPFMTAYDAQGILYDNHNRYLHGPERSNPFVGLSLAVHAGRFVSVLLGLMTLLGVYGAAREVSPQQPIVALIATALTAFQPVFISLTSAITNDAAVICFASLSTWMALRIVRKGATPRLAVLGGLSAGLTALSKFNGVWIAGIVWLAIIGAQWIQLRTSSTSADKRISVTPLLLSLATWSLVIGWWYIRNYVTAGDPFGLAIHAIGDQSPLRLSQSGLQYITQHLVDLETSTWFASGWADLVPAPEWLYTIYRLIFGIGALGALCAAGQTWRNAGSLWRIAPRISVQVLCMILCLLLGLAGAVYWILVYMWTLGRLMFPAIASAALLTALGWGWWLRRRPLRLQWTHAPTLGSVRLCNGVYMPVVGWCVTIALFAGLLRGGIGTVVTTAVTLNRNPDITAPGAKTAQTQLTFFDPTDAATPVASIVGYEIPPQDLRPGGTLYARICWSSTGYTRRDFPYSIQLVGENDVRPATRSSYHGLGTYPLTAWEPGQVFCDPTSVQISGLVDRPRAYNVVVTMFDFVTNTQQMAKPLPVVDAANRPVYPVITRMRIAPSRSPAKQPAATELFGDFAALVDAHIDAQTQPDSGTVLSVTMHWLARNSTPVDAKIFMHVLDSSGKVIAQNDHEPDGGWFPTHYWQAGDLIEDRFEIHLPQGAHYEDLQTGVGMYDSKTLQRLAAFDIAGRQRARDDILLMRK